MATTVEDFKLRISVEGEGKIKAVSAAMGDLNKDIDAFGQVGGPLGNTINGIVGRLGTMATVGLGAAAAFVGLGAKALQIAGELSDISGATGIATGQIQNFRTSLIAAGGKAEDASLILSKLNQSVQEAAGGNGKLQKAFKDLGVYVTDANGKIRPTGDILQDITEKAQRGEITQQAYAAAVDILGKNINKLELGKLSALRNPVADEDNKRLDAYNEKIDAIRDRLSRGIVTFFGSVAEQAEKAFAAIDKYEKKIADREAELNKKGLTARMATGPGQPLMSGAIVGANLPDEMQRRMTAEEKAFVAQRERYAEQEKLMKAYKSRAGVGRDDMGGFGSETPEAQKARLDSEKRFEQSRNEIINNLRLTGANDLQAIEINAANEIAKATLEIRAKENLSKFDQDREIAVKTAEIEQKAALDTARLRMQQNAKVYTELEAQRQKSAEESAAEEKRINDIINTSKELNVEQQNQIDAQKRKNKFLLDNLTASDRERSNAQAIFNLEEERVTLLRNLAKIKDLPYAERLQQEFEINQQIDARIGLTTKQQELDAAGAENFSIGWGKAYNQYLENTRNAANTAASLFQTLTTGFEDAWVKFIKTGKLSFKDLVNTMIAEMARAQARNLFASLFGPVGSNNNLSGPASAAVLGLPGYASGGLIPANQLSVVGEKGPELFIPKTSGTILPNNMLSAGSPAGLGNTSVTYNINAVDAISFKSMIARDPSFIHAVAMQGAKNVPTRR